MILIDTHVLIWYLTQPDLMSAESEKIVSAGFQGPGVGISDISLWEVAMLVQKRRVEFNKDVKLWLTDLNALPNFTRIRISPAIAALSTRLPDDFHSDPADRIIVATALELGIPLVTKDERIRRYVHVDTVW